MPLEFFEPKKLAPESLALVSTMIRILDSYKNQGYDLSLRQLYYQLVSRNVVPNTEQSYKRVGGILSDARLAGYIDWDMIVDRGRETTQNSHWDSISDILNACASQFRHNLWEDQPYHVEVMVEKQALEGVLEPVCKDLDIPFTANKGYSSSSAMYQCGKRLRRALESGKDIAILYLGDHDPSGIDMTRDVETRLRLFSGYDQWAPKNAMEMSQEELVAVFRSNDSRKFEMYGNSGFDGQAFVVERIALNMEQIDRYSPPPNPAKTTDSRSQSYIDLYGTESWELDALEPAVLAQLVIDSVDEYRDEELFREALKRQDASRGRLIEIANAERSC